MEALLEQILMSYDFGHFTFFLIFFLLSVKSEIYLRGKSVSVNTKQKRFFLVFLLSVEALLEVDPNEFLIWDI